MASQSHRICAADSSSCRHLSQVGSSVSPSFRRCPFRWQCPVSNPTTHLSWSLFSSNRSFVCLAEGLDIPCKSLCLFESSSGFPIFFMIPVCPVPDRFLGSFNWDAASWFRSYERIFRSFSCQLICRFITVNTLMTWNPYQLNSVMFSQLN
jgi:hypothetical protein